MSMETALHLTQVLMALAFIQQSVEHLVTDRNMRGLFTLRIVLSAALLANLFPTLALGGLALISLAMLARFHGPYNGGSDKMSVLILWCLLGAHLGPQGFWQEVLLGYLALQVVLSYFISGKVKLANKDWRSGRALGDVFAFSAYPVAENLRVLSQRPTLLKAASWGVIGFELTFPLGLAHPGLLIVMLAIATCFHLANACLFGLNRFLWIWIAGYPALTWLQMRLMGG